MQRGFYKRMVRASDLFAVQRHRSFQSDDRRNLLYGAQVMKKPVAIWTRYDDGSLDYCLVEEIKFSGGTPVAGGIGRLLRELGRRLYVFVGPVGYCAKHLKTLLLKPFA